jgi:hypothetical protein
VHQEEVDADEHAVERGPDRAKGRELPQHRGAKEPDACEDDEEHERRARGGERLHQREGERHEDAPGDRGLADAGKGHAGRPRRCLISILGQAQAG